MKHLLGDYQAFYDDLTRRLRNLSISVDRYSVSHLAVRVDSHESYLDLRDRLEGFAAANVENRWSGRPISKILLADPLPLGGSHEVELIELIPPVHGQGYPMGLEHLGFVVGEEFDAFRERHVDNLTGQQDQGPINQPVFVTFENRRSVKFHRWSLREVVTQEGHRFDGFYHAEQSNNPHGRA